MAACTDLVYFSHGLADSCRQCTCCVTCNIYIVQIPIPIPFRTSNQNHRMYIRQKQWLEKDDKKIRQGLFVLYLLMYRICIFLLDHVLWLHCSINILLKVGRLIFLSSYEIFHSYTNYFKWSSNFCGSRFWLGVSNTIYCLQIPPLLWLMVLMCKIFQ